MAPRMTFFARYQGRVENIVRDARIKTGQQAAQGTN
jgi:hypothetical protein